MDLSQLTDDALFGCVETLARNERFTLVDFILHLGELDARPACKTKGFPSTFSYLTQQLGYSESDAMRRVRTARAARRYPSILRLLGRGELHLVGVSMIEPLLTPANHEGLIRKACRRSTRDIERLVAELSPPIAGPRDRIRALPSPPADAVTPAPIDPTLFAATAPACAVPAPIAEPISAELVPASSVMPTYIEPALFEESAVQTPPLAVAPPLPTLSPPPPASDPLAPAAPQPRRFSFTFTASEEVNGWYEQARDLLRHRFPAAAMEDIIGDALRRLVETELSNRCSKRPGTRKERGQGGEPTTRYIPKWVEDIVWRRDGGRCAYLGPDGHRCGETAWLELDHIIPWARGGRSDDPGNIRLLCRAHNQSEAARVFGVKA